MTDPRAEPGPFRLADLERHALDGCADDLASTERRLQAFTCYLAMREKICNDFLPLIASRQPFINDHTRSHLQRVLRHIEALLQRHFPAQDAMRDIPASREVGWADTMVLLNALVWHDLGNVRGRDGHASEVRQLFEAISDRLYDDKLAALIKDVAEAHSGPDAITRVIPERASITAFRNETVHPHFLAAVLRFADELDEDRERIAGSQYPDLNLVPRANNRYWFFNSVNDSIRVLDRASDVGAYSAWVTVHSSFPSTRFDEPLEVRPGETVPAMTEYLSRLAKIERERRYCNPFLQRAYNHTGVTGIEVTIETRQPGARQSAADVLILRLTDTLSLADALQDPGLAALRPYLALNGSTTHGRPIQDP